MVNCPGCYCKSKAVRITMEWFYLPRETESYGVHSAHNHNHGSPFGLVSGTAGWAWAPVFVKRRRLGNARHLCETAGQTSDCPERGGDVCLSDRRVSILFSVFLNVPNKIAVENKTFEEPSFSL